MGKVKARVVVRLLQTKSGRDLLLELLRTAIRETRPK